MDLETRAGKATISVLKDNINQYLLTIPKKDYNTQEFQHYIRVSNQYDLYLRYKK